MNFGCRVCQKCVQIGQISVIFDKTAKKTNNGADSNLLSERKTSRSLQLPQMANKTT
jgi:hypothetical protein